MFWYEILTLIVCLSVLVSITIFLMVLAYKEQIKIQDLRKWQIKFYKTIIEVYNNENT